MKEKYLAKEVTFLAPDKAIKTIEFWTGKVAEVSLLSAPASARQTLAKTINGYKGIYSSKDLPEPEISALFQDLQKTKLGTPAEMLNFVFLVRDVPRSWTHQAVRTRIGAAAVQESTRFIGSKSVYKVLAPNTVLSDGKVSNSYIEGTVQAIRSYEELLSEKGVTSQDARNILPHSLLTNMYWSLTLRALMGIYDVRWCCQAEPSTWLPVMEQMKNQISESCGAEIAAFLSSPFTRGEPSCGFGASFDRPCAWRKHDNPGV